MQKLTIKPGKRLKGKAGKVSFSFDPNFSINGVKSQLALSSVTEDTLLYLGDGDRLEIKLCEGYALLTASRTFREETKLFESRYFTGGIRPDGFDRALSPQFWHNKNKDLALFQDTPDLNARYYYAPSALCFAIGNEKGSMGVACLDLPDSKVCRMEHDFSFIVESAGGNKSVPAGGTYTLPTVALYALDDEFDVCKAYRAIMADTGRIPGVGPLEKEIPAWWYDPQVCTYGDQLIEVIVGDEHMDQAWVKAFAECAERDWGIEHMTLCIDDSWQYRWSGEGRVDEKRFPDLRGLIDEMHARGHHVILWYTPLMDYTDRPYKLLSEEMGVLSPLTLENLNYNAEFFGGTSFIDYTADNARAFLRRVLERMLGDGEGQLNADGVKIDFMGVLRDPASTTVYAHPERGVGMRELLLFHKMFYEEAKRIKPDALINASAVHPYFEPYIDIIRLHDNHVGNFEKDMRARLVLDANRTALVDSDGALMYKAWANENYTNAVIYSTPALYYLRQFQEGRSNRDMGMGEYWRGRLTPNEQKAYGKLFRMTHLRPKGTPRYTEGGWQIIGERGEILGESFHGDSVVFYPTEPGGKGYLFTLRDEVIKVPLRGHRLKNLTPGPRIDILQVDYARDFALVWLMPGELHTFEDGDDGRSIDRLFRKQ